MSSLLISNTGNARKGTKKRKTNEGVPEELKQGEDSDEEDDAVAEDLDQFVNDRPRKGQGAGSARAGGKVIGTRANHATGNKKRQFGQFQKEQASARSELS